MRQTLRIFRREAGTYFASPVAYLFIGTFLAVTFFIFFWGEAFFARDIADVRLLFQWMPILLIGLVAALTMRSWSEERRSESIEMLMTAPVSSLSLVTGKLLAALSLVIVALILTLPLAFTVNFLGPLDWGPVIGGYIATIFLAAAYVSMGLFISSRTDNQIVSLIVTVLLGAAFYVVGAPVLTHLVPMDVATVMRWFGTGSRFRDIARGVLDIRSLYYYVSLVGIFMVLNIHSLEKLRRGGKNAGGPRHWGWNIAIVLIAVNFLVANVWLTPISSARFDMTANNRYTLSPVTKLYLSKLQEPLIIRGYFSHDTNKLLKPLTLQMRDLLQEYAEAGGSKVHVEFVNPNKNRKAASKAGRRYGIKPVSLYSSGAYKTSVVNAYFDVLVKYGNQHAVLRLRDLVNVKGGMNNTQANLNNPEYEITRAIRKVVTHWHNGGNLFASLSHPVTFHAYISAPGELPKPLHPIRKKLQSVLKNMQKKSSGKLQVHYQNPGADKALAKKLRTRYGFMPMTTGLPGSNNFYFYMLLQQGQQTVPIHLPNQPTESSLRKAIQSGLKRFGKGYVKTIAVYHPGSHRRYMGGQAPTFQKLIAGLRQDNAVIQTQLKNGQVPNKTDLLLVLAPSSLNDKQRFAIDQFLMQGGSVVVAASPIQILLNRRSGIHAIQNTDGLKKWLDHYGIHIKNRLVADPHSGSLVLPTRGPNGGMELRSINYPLFIGLNGGQLGKTPLLGSLHQLTMAWASPISVNSQEKKPFTVTPLLRSSDRAWTVSSKNILPNFKRYPKNGFPVSKKRGQQTLAVMLKGRFKSAFAGKPSPLVANNKKQKSGKSAHKNGKGKKNNTPLATSVIQRSPAGTRLVVFGSSGFLSDTALEMMSMSTQSRYRQPIQLMQNVIDGLLETPMLAKLRGQNHDSRLLRPVSDTTRTALEVANYAIALGGLILLFLLERMIDMNRRRHHAMILDNKEAAQ